MGIALSGAVYFFAQESDNRRVEQILEFRADWRASNFEEKIKRAAAPVNATGSYVSAHAFLVPEDFQHFVRKLFEAAPPRAIYWAPRVADAGRRNFEASARLLGEAGFEISQWDASGSLVSATQRPEYFPLWLSERFENVPRLDGFDPASDPVFAAAFARARDQGITLAMSATVLSVLTLTEPIYRIIVPVYDSAIIPVTVERRRETLRGFVIGSFAVRKILESAIEYTPRIVETIHFYTDAHEDPSLTDQPLMVYEPSSGVFLKPKDALAQGPAGDGYETVRHFKALGHDWTLISTFPEHVLSEQRSSLPLALLLSGLLSTALVAAYVGRQTVVRNRIEGIVAARTADLSAANRDLGREVEERKRVEIALKQQAETLTAALEALPVAVIYLDHKRRILFWSRAAEKIFGYPAEAILKRPFALQAPDDQAAVDEAFDTVAAGQILRDYPFRCRHKDGRLLDVRFSAAGIFEGKQIRGIVGILEDVTDRQVMEGQLLQAQKMEALGQLTGGLAHDFNNLLLVIMGNLQLLEELRSDDQEIGEFISEAQKAADRGAELVRSLLAFARRQPLRPRAVDINEVVATMTRMLERVLGGQIEVTLQPGKNIWQVMIDPIQVEAALVNLATNARDAMPKGGRLTIATANRRLDADYVAQHPDAVAGDYAMLQVSDTGTGIPPEVMARIFEPFFSTKGPGKGSGLGLSMIFGFMKQSGGHINVYSEVGMGTTFRLYLPRHRGAKEVSEVAPVTVSQGGHETVLVVEDDPALRRLVTHELTNLGYKVRAAENAVTALEVLESGDQIDLVFSDVVMAGKLDGLDLARLVQSRWPAIKVVLTSGFPDAKLDEDVALIRSVRLLSKPYRKAELSALLRSVLDGTPQADDD
ncbi:CHASE domain-containing protein [Oceanibaculum pacificum]|uniref:histidine kinase n=1 Tax=Oceanibaculum pacificum TaxID=580166 RepID=A0A154VYP0_9PROT|nr:CHASE domain-containing protein [Oceanibaculum pacificum]KZD06347.1 hypothetical protein AUP43_10910 [Oceanibaculum pacificum]